MTNASPQAFSCSSVVPTPSARKYMQQLCKHWSHNLDVNFDETNARVAFPATIRGSNWKGDGALTMTAEDNQLICEINASEPAQLDGLKNVVESHLNRFGFREAPLGFNWKD